MKIELTNHNPLRLVLDYLATAEGFVTHSKLEHIKGYLELGGVVCETEGEVLVCLAIMHNLGMIELTNDEENYYEVKVIYGK